MDTLFDIGKGAIFSDDRKYRYCLFRIWDYTKPKVMFIGLNPSSANEVNDDPTIRRVVNFAASWGYGGIYMMNLFALVSPVPDELTICNDPVADNDKWLRNYRTLCDKVIFAWGNFKQAKERSIEVIKMFPKAEALMINKDGSPRHPLYIPGNFKPKPFKC